ncbi:MAG: DEAD/DEAH box helicase [bacterium]
MEDSGLHPRLVALLRSQGWEGLTEAQTVAHGPLAAGKHVLLVAPTGHGKTEAALLPVLSRIVTEKEAVAARKKPWPAGFKVLYVTPLRALNRDLQRRLESWSKALGITLGVRHGDTTQSERTKQSKSPPDLLITTPETLQLLLYGDTLRRHLATVRFVVLDEVHDLAASERGAQLMVALERVEEVVGQGDALRMAKAAERPCPAKPDARAAGGFQRIGLSATVADPVRVARFLAGNSPDGTARPTEVLVVETLKEIRLAVVEPLADPGDGERAAKLTLTPPVVAQVRTVRQIASEHKRVLIFHNTRDGAELLVSRSAMLDDEPGEVKLGLGLHHGSLSAEHRTDVEERFKNGELRALVATSSLELGIDVGAIDHVVQVQSPRSVARLVQRLGRSGHHVGGVSAGTLVAAGPEDILECAAVARRAVEGRLESLELRDAPLVVLANQLIALTNEYAGLQKEWCRAVVRRAGPFVDLDDGLFDAVWQCLQDVRTLYPEETVGAGRGGAQPGDRIQRGSRARKHFLDHISLIPDERTYKVIDESSKRSIGTVDDAFVTASMAPGALVVMAGRSWRVLEVEVEAARVRVAPVRELGPVPQWTGAQLPVSYDVAQEVARLRRLICESDKRGLAAYPLDAGTLASAAKPIVDHKAKGLQVATDRLVTLEMNGKLIVASVSLGTRGNEALGRITQALLSQRLGAPVGMECDAYRIHFTLPSQQPAQSILDVWQSLDAGSLELLLSLCLRDSPLVRHHLVHVAKHFGALPKDLDPNVATRGKLESLLDHLALQEETLSRLIHSRMDVAAVHHFVEALRAGKLTFVIQAQGPLTFLGQDETRRMMAPPRSDEALLTAVRKRIEDSDVLLACCACGNSWQSRVLLLPKRPACRRCQSHQVACLRPWNEDQVPLLRSKAKLAPDKQAERLRIVRNGDLVSNFGSTACRALVGRGVGPETAGRILQKVADLESPAFWREILLAELTFARTNAFWRR